MTGGSVTTPMTCSLPPHREQWLISMLKTRFSRESQVIGALGGSKVWPFYSVLGTADFMVTTR